jgi:hypothetical protein
MMRSKQCSCPRCERVPRAFLLLHAGRAASVPSATLERVAGERPGSPVRADRIERRDRFGECVHPLEVLAVVRHHLAGAPEVVQGQRAVPAGGGAVRPER